MSSLPAKRQKKVGLTASDPKVWAETVQELCEGTDYFHAYQSAVYTRDNVAISILLNGHPAQRDLFHKGVFITHGGGRSCEVIGNDGSRRFRLSSSQKRSDPGVRSLFNSMIQQVPLIAIIGDKYQLADFEIPHPYCVLGWFAITHAWAEVEYADGKICNRLNCNEYTRYKFRFERLENQDPPWWYHETSLANEPYPSEENTPNHEPISFQDDFLLSMALGQPVQSAQPSFQTYPCYFCGSNYPKVFAECFMCLNESCPAFWKIGVVTPDNKLIMTKPTSGLSYDPSFFSTAFLKPAKYGPHTSLPSVIPKSRSNDVNCKACYCSQCGRLSCREELCCWRCPTCGNSTSFRTQILRPLMNMTPRKSEMEIPSPDYERGVGITVEVRVTLSGTTEVLYNLPRTGLVIHRIASCAMFQEAKTLLDAYLNEDEPRPPFRRCRLSRSPLGNKPFLSNQFQFNVGEPYKFVTSVDTIPFSDAPQSVIQAMDILKRETGYQDFNELLSIAYLQGQKIGWHDDGEKEVGDFISTLSLGSPATMYFRRHRFKAKRCETHHQNQSQELAGIINMKEKRGLFHLNLNHGDVLIMKGRHIQKYLEHQVIPQGFRIAITARHMMND